MMRLIFFAALILFTTFREGYSKPHRKVASYQNRNTFVVFDKNYLDLRIDRNQDGKIDYWEIQKNNLKLQIFYGSQNNIFVIKKFLDKNVLEKVYINKNGKFILASNKTRPQKHFHYSESNCTGETKELKISSDVLSITDNEKDLENFILKLSPSCMDSVVDINNIFHNLQTRKNELVNCIQNAPSEIYNGLSIQADAISSKFFAYLEKIRSDIEEEMLICEGDEVKTDEQKIYLPIDVSGNLKADGKKIFHELVHINDISQIQKSESSDKNAVDPSEKLAQDLTTLCFDKKPIDLSADPILVDGSNGWSLPITDKLLSEGTAEAGTQGSVAISPAVAETLQQNGPTVSPAAMNRVADSSGASTANKISNQQTSAMVASANTLLGPTPAYASETNSSSTSRGPASTGSSTASATSSGSGSSKSSRSPIKAYGKNEVTMPKGLKHGTKLASDEYIKEEIDLTKSNSASSPSRDVSRPSRASNSRDASARPSTSRTPPEPSPSASGAGSSSAAASAVVPRGNVGSTDVSPISNTPSSGGSPRTSAARTSTSRTPRTPASVKPSSEGTNRIVEAFTASYGQMKNRLRQPRFIETLKENSITVYDYTGNKFGADRGEIVFVDKGDRFVRQK